MDLKPGGAVTPDLVLQRPLRAGAMGALWVAEDRRRGHEVAVKFVAPRLARHGTTRERFKREAEAAQRVDHPNVIEIFDHGVTEDGTLFISMELLQGETLSARVERMHVLSLAMTAYILRQIGAALEAAHGLGFIHRDIKPDNIFLIGGDLPTVKVLDFGMAKDITPPSESRGDYDDLTMDGVAVGTPEYMSPEQVLGSDDLDERTDVWALGVVTFYMLGGYLPFGGKSPHALFFSVCRGAFPALDRLGIPTELEPWFTRVFAPNRDNRFPSVAEAVQAFEAIRPKIGGDFGSLDDDATQMVNVAALLAEREDATAELAPAADHDVSRRLARHEAAESLSALQADDFDLPEDDLPTFQLSADTAAALRAEMERRVAGKPVQAGDEEAVPLLLLKPSTRPPPPPDGGAQTSSASPRGHGLASTMRSTSVAGTPQHLANAPPARAAVKSYPDPDAWSVDDALRGPEPRDSVAGFSSELSLTEAELFPDAPKPGARQPEARQPEDNGPDRVRPPREPALPARAPVASAEGSAAGSVEDVPRPSEYRPSASPPPASRAERGTAWMVGLAVGMLVAGLGAAFFLGGALDEQEAAPASNGATPAPQPSPAPEPEVNDLEPEMVEPSPSEQASADPSTDATAAAAPPPRPYPYPVPPPVAPPPPPPAAPPPPAQPPPPSPPATAPPPAAPPPATPPSPPPPAAPPPEAPPPAAPPPPPPASPPPPPPAAPPPPPPAAPPPPPPAPAP